MRPMTATPMPARRCADVPDSTVLFGRPPAIERSLSDGCRKGCTAARARRRFDLERELFFGGRGLVAVRLAGHALRRHHVDLPSLLLHREQPLLLHRLEQAGEAG